MRLRMLLISLLNILLYILAFIAGVFVLLHVLLPIKIDRVVNKSIWLSQGYSEKDISHDTLSPHVKIIPSWWKYTPFLGSNMATTIYPKIYLPWDMYRRFAGGSASVWDRSVLLHEEIHIRRQKPSGLRGHIKYLFLPEHRLLEELVPIYIQMKYLKAHGETYDVLRKSRQFSSPAYLWVQNFEDSQDLLSMLWSQA